MLVPYLIDALSAERERLAAAGAALPDGTLEVEIVAAPEDLERRTSLDARQIAAGAPAACEGGTASTTLLGTALRLLLTA